MNLGGGHNSVHRPKETEVLGDIWGEELRQEVSRSPGPYFILCEV